MAEAGKKEEEVEEVVMLEQVVVVVVQREPWLVEEGRWVEEGAGRKEAEEGRGGPLTKGGGEVERTIEHTTPDYYGDSYIFMGGLR